MLANSIYLNYHQFLVKKAKEHLSCKKQLITEVLINKTYCRKSSDVAFRIKKQSGDFLEDRGL